MRNFFNSLDYISLLEASMAEGNKSATMYKLMSKTRHLLGEKEGSLKAYNVISNKKYISDLSYDIRNHVKNNPNLSFKEVLSHFNITYHNYKYYFSDEQKTRAREFLIYKHE